MPDVTSGSLPIDLQKTYDRRFAALSSYRTQVWSLLTKRVFQPLVPEQGVVLDLGCGWGEFINQIRAGRRFGMDLNPATRQRLDPQVTFLEQDCSKTWQLDDASLDMVFTSNFLEHLQEKADLQRTLTQAFRCLKPGGRLICVGPNIKFLPGAYWDFWDHFLPLTELSLREVLEIEGFVIERCVDRFLPYTMSQGFRPPLWAVSLYLRVPAIWPWFGKQFLIVAVKPS